MMVAANWSSTKCCKMHKGIPQTCWSLMSELQKHVFQIFAQPKWREVLATQLDKISILWCNKPMTHKLIKHRKKTISLSKVSLKRFLENESGIAEPRAWGTKAEEARVSSTHTYHKWLSFVPQQDVAVARFSSKPQRQVTPNNESIIRMREPAAQNKNVDEYKHTMTGSGNHRWVLPSTLA